MPVFGGGDARTSTGAQMAPDGPQRPFSSLAADLPRRPNTKFGFVFRCLADLLAGFGPASAVKLARTDQNPVQNFPGPRPE